MNESQEPVFTDAELEASLRGLGVTELEQRLEFAPLLAGSVDGGTQDTQASVCCSCKTVFKSKTLASRMPRRRWLRQRQSTGGLLPSFRLAIILQLFPNPKPQPPTPNPQT